MGKEFSVQIFDVSKGSDVSSSELHMETEGDLEKLWNDAADELYRNNLATAVDQIDLNIGREPGFRARIECGDDSIFAKEEKFRDLFFYRGEEMIILSLLHCWGSASKLREMNYKGTVYQNIKDTEFLEEVFAFEDDMYKYVQQPVRFAAQKDGKDILVYFFGDAYDDRREDDGGRYYMEQLSRGVVEVGPEQMYIGTYNCHESSYESCEIVRNEIDEDICYGHTIDSEGALHIFLETDEKGVTFSALLDGRLYKKISQNNENIIFYDTPFDKDKLSSDEWKQGENIKDIVFKNTDGKYLYSIENKNIEEGRFSAITITPPQTPDLDSMTKDSARRLFEDYIRALYEAFSNAQEYHVGDYCFIRCESAEPCYIAQTDDYGLTVRGRLSPKALDLPYIHECYGFDDTDFAIECAYCVEDGIRTVLSFEEDRRDLLIRVGEVSPDNDDEWTGEPYSDQFFRLKNETECFAGSELPDIEEFSCSADDFLEELDIYVSIRDAVVRFFNQGCAVVAGKAARETMTAAEMEEYLYDDGRTPDKDVVAFALEMRNDFIRSGRIPNVAVIGEAGTGKTDLAYRIGKVFGRTVLHKSPADFQSAYESATNKVVIDLLIEAASQKGDPKIIFMDEAYTLMKNKHGQEAVSILLPLMTGDRTDATVKYWTHGVGDLTTTVDFKAGTVTTSVDGSNNEPTVVHIRRGVPPIWIGGYEDDIRLMLKENQGLYRRFKRVVLKSPTTDQLLEKLQKDLTAGLEELSQQGTGKKNRKCLIQRKDNSNMKGDVIENLKSKLELLLKYCRENEELIKKFFRWGTQPQNSKYFANYAGVETFVNRCLDGINFGMPEERTKPEYAGYIRGQIEAIIRETKRDIKHQLDTIRRKGNNHSGGNGDAAEQVEMIVDNKTRFSDLVGCDNQRQYMQSIIDMLLKKEEYERFGITVPKGALLMGLPGVGKTFIARAMAGELQEQFETKDPNRTVGFMSLSAPELTMKPVSFIGSIFDKAEEFDVCVIFIDEVDAIAKNRFQNKNYSHFIELIKQMDGIEQRSNVFVLAATNAPESLDPAFTRSGRIDKKLEFDLPDENAIRELTQRNIIKRIQKLKFIVKEENGRKTLENKKWAKEVERLSKNIAENLSGRGCTPGDVENIVNTAFIMYENSPRQAVPDPVALKFESTKLTKLYYYLYEATERHFIGDPGLIRKNEAFNSEKNDNSRSSVAVHEVGHALVRILQGNKPFEKITCLPRGEALGYVMPSKEKLFTKAEFKERICSVMGGRIAEEIVYGKDNISTGASADMRQATRIARLMVERWGFADEFEFMVLQEDTARYLGGSEYGCSEAFREQSDRAVCDLLRKLYQETKGMLANKKELILFLAEEVFKRKTMTGDEFKKFYDKSNR